MPDSGTRHGMAKVDRGDVEMLDLFDGGRNQEVASGERCRAGAAFEDGDVVAEISQANGRAAPGRAATDDEDVRRRLRGHGAEVSAVGDSGSAGLGGADDIHGEHFATSPDEVMGFFVSEGELAGLECREHR